MLHYEIQGDSLIIYIKDELDHHAVTYLRETSDRLIEAGNVKNIVFDFKDVSFMDSSGIGLIMEDIKRLCLSAEKRQLQMWEMLLTVYLKYQDCIRL